MFGEVREFNSRDVGCALRAGLCAREWFPAGSIYTTDDSSVALEESLSTS